MSRGYKKWFCDITRGGNAYMAWVKRSVAAHVPYAQERRFSSQPRVTGPLLQEDNRIY